MTPRNPLLRKGPEKRRMSIRWDGKRKAWKVTTGGHTRWVNRDFVLSLLIDSRNTYANFSLEFTGATEIAALESMMKSLGGDENE